MLLAAAPQSNVLDPQGPHARAILDLAAVTTVVLGLVFFVVVGAIVFSLVRFRGREGVADPRQFAGHATTEIVWTAVPLLIVLLLFGLTWRTMGKADPTPPPTPDLVVTGRQFWWEARYADSGVVVANEIHVPVGRPFAIRLESSDVLHEFWVPNLTRKMTAVPGQPNHIWMQADRPGSYVGICSEFCGTQHAWMRFLVVAEEPEKFDAWQKAQRSTALAPTSEAAVKGLALFASSSCVNCHDIAGLRDGAPARVGPDLTHFASRRQLGAGVAENTPENLRRWLRNPHALKPGVLMPAYGFSDEQIAQLAAYLETLR